MTILGPILTSRDEGRAIYAPEGRLLREGEQIRIPELADLLDRLGTEGAEFLYTGDVAAAVSEYVLERGGLLTTDDLAAYAPIEREPAHAHYRGRDILNRADRHGAHRIGDAGGFCRAAGEDLAVGPLHAAEADRRQRHRQRHRLAEDRRCGVAPLDASDDVLVQLAEIIFTLCTWIVLLPWASAIFLNVAAPEEASTMTFSVPIVLPSTLTFASTVSGSL